MSADWSSRVGEPAAAVIRRASIWRRAGGASLAFFLVLAFGFELDHFYRPGIEGSVIFGVFGMFGLFYSIRLMARARRLVAARLEMPPKDARWVRLRHGEAGFDRWLAGRGQPGWPE